MLPYRKTSKPAARRRPLFRIEAESLETRQLLTGGGGNTIALSTGTIPTAGGVASAPFVVESGHFTVPKGQLTLGVDVVASGSSTVQPKIVGITQDGKNVPLASQPITSAQTAAGDTPHAVLATIHTGNPRHAKAFAGHFATRIAGQNNTSGDFLLGYYLPGDANGDGKVTQADVNAIKALNGKTVNDTTYSFDADSNRDGKINSADVKIARGNLGVSTTITPSFTANLSPATDDGAADRITNHPVVTFTGTTAPGAAVTYSEVNDKTPVQTTTADNTGNYTLNVPLTVGTSTFNVSSTDAFGQTIAGSIQPVTYTTAAVPAATSTTSTS